MNRLGLIISACALLSAGLFPACAQQVARLVTSEEITGVVVESGTGKPILNAIVAIRFARDNTGHTGRHCFRSMAVQTDASGRFRFASWKQENTRANSTFGEITAYRVGYSSLLPHVRVDLSRNVPYRDTLEIPKANVRLELRPFAGSDEDRIAELRRLVGNFACRMQAEFDDTALLFAVRDEIVASPFATRRPQDGGYSALEWIDQIIKRDSSRK